MAEFNPEDLTKSDLIDIVCGILNIMFPDDDPESEWSTDELPAIAELLENYGLIP